MSKEKKTSKGLIPIIILFVFFVLILLALVLFVHKREGNKSKRTILFYGVGSNLESVHANLTYNLNQCMEAAIPEDVNLIVITGGATRWYLPEDRLFDEAGNPTAVDPDKKQIWKLTGTNGGEKGRMTLLTSLDSYSDKYMTDPDVLRTFVDYCVDNYPAKKYDMILWDHGYGPLGYGSDEMNSDLGEYEEAPMSLDQIAKALDESKMKQKFELIDFDACLMSNVEVMLALSDHADNFVVSADSSPEFGQYYTNWLNLLADEPDIDGFELGKKIVDDSIAFYKDETSDGYGRPSTLAVINSKRFNARMIKITADFTKTLSDELYSGNDDFDFRDRIISANTAVRYNWPGLVDYGDFAKSCSFDGVSNQIEEVLYEDNSSADAMMYFSCTDNYKASPEHTPSGISIFFPSRDSRNSKRYINAMEALKNYIEDNNYSLKDKRIETLDSLIKIAAGYTAINNTGYAVSVLSSEGKTDIGYEDVTAFLGEKEQPSIKEKEQSEEVGSTIDMSYRESPMEKGLSFVIERANEYAGSVDWLKNISEKQAAEVLTPEALAVSEKDGGYHVDINEKAAKTFDYTKGVREEFSVGAKRELTDPDTMQKKKEDYDAVIGTYYSDADLNITTFDKKWYELEDAKGKTYLVSVIGNGQTGIIPIVIEDSYEDSDGNSVPNYMAGYITIETTDGKANILGFHTYYSYEEGEFTPDIAETKPLYTGYRTKTTNTMMLNADEAIAVDKDAENYGVNVKAGVDMKDIDDVNDQLLKSVKCKYYINDIYGFEQEITELFK